MTVPVRWRLDFSHVNEHKFKHNFADTLDPLFYVHAL